MTFTILFITTSYQSLKLVTLTYNEVTVTNLRIHYTVVIEKLVNVTKQCSDVHYIVFTVKKVILVVRFNTSKCIHLKFLILQIASYVMTEFTKPTIYAIQVQQKILWISWIFE